VAFCMSDCTPGIHPVDPEEYRTPWNCSILTWGCSDAWQLCEGAEGQKENIIPCCQWGCICNYTNKFFHQCVPPEGQPHCSKDGPQKRPSFADDPLAIAESSNVDGSKMSIDDDAVLYEADFVTKAESAYRKHCYEIDGRWIGLDCQEEKLEVHSWKTLYTAKDSSGPWGLAGVLAVGVLSVSTVMARRRCCGAGYHGELRMLLPVDPSSCGPAE